MTIKPETAEPKEPASRPVKRLAFWAITLLAPVLLLLGVLEFGLRLASPGRVAIDPDTLDTRLRESAHTEVRVVTTGNLRGLIQPSEVPDLVYELKPSRRWVFQGADTHTNSHGMRGEEYSLEKPAGSFRVAGLGDSVMFGWAVDQNDTYTSQLQRRLDNEGRHVEVLNFAVPGYNSAQEAAILRGKALRFSPDVLLVNYTTNDWVEPFFVVDPNLGSIIESSLLLQNIRNRLVPGFDMTFLEAQRGMDKVSAALRQIGEDARSRGIPVLFYTYPHPSNPGDQATVERLAEENDLTYVDLYDRFATYVREHQLPSLDALNVAPNDKHPNADAHGVIAEALAREIEWLLPARGGGPGVDPRQSSNSPAHRQVTVRHLRPPHSPTDTDPAFDGLSTEERAWVRDDARISGLDVGDVYPALLRPRRAHVDRSAVGAVVDVR